MKRFCTDLFNTNKIGKFSDIVLSSLKHSSRETPQMESKLNAERICNSLLQKAFYKINCDQQSLVN